MNNWPVPVSALSEMIDELYSADPLSARIRAFNHQILEEFNKITPIAGTRFLDVGASIQGYALEAALKMGVQNYEGATFSKTYWQSSKVEFVGPNGEIGRIWDMNAEKLEFEDNTFDCVLSASTFEHFLRPPIVLTEMHRVLKPGGSVVICFDGIWSSSYGYHLLQFGEQIDRIVPPWSHLFLDERQMRQALADRWPDNAPISLSEAIKWIYHSDELNRLGFNELKRAFETSPLSLQWLLPFTDTREKELASIAEYVATFVPYSAAELLIRGMSVHLKKP